MVAIVIYKEANIVAIISILLSMLSVASKSFVFSIATALTMKQLFFNWLSGISDFFGIFFAVSWAFYEPNDKTLQPAFNIIQAVWFYRLYCCTLPLIALSSILGHISAMYEWWPGGQKKCAILLLFVLITIVWACGIIASTVVSEIFTWV